MSRIEAVYSARFSRWNDRRPGFGRASAAASIFVSSDAGERRRASPRAGARAPAGGIMPARSFRIIFSATSARCSAFAGSKPSRTRSPLALSASWHSRQYRSMTALSDVRGARREARGAAHGVRGDRADAAPGEATRAAAAGLAIAAAMAARPEQNDRAISACLRGEVYGFPDVRPLPVFAGSALGLRGRQERLDLAHGVLDFHVENALSKGFGRGPAVPGNRRCWAPRAAPRRPS